MPWPLSRKKTLETAAKKPEGSTRILKEAARMEREPPPMCRAHIAADNMYEWVGYIEGPEDSAYAGGKFPFKLHLPPNYPYSPPRMMFQAKIYHPNIKSTNDDPNGFYVCIDILQQDWSPTLTIDGILLSVLSLLTDPNPDHPNEPEIAKQYKADRAEFERTAKEYTRLYAMEK